MFAGGTVVIAISGLALAGIPAVTAMGLSSALVVAVMVVASITLLPALLGFAGLRLLGPACRGAPARPTTPSGTSGSPAWEHRPTATDRWHRWGDQVTAHPWRYLIGGTRGASAGSPCRCCRMRLGQTDAGTSPPSQHHPQGLRPARRRLRPRLQRPAAAVDRARPVTPRPTPRPSTPWRPASPPTRRCAVAAPAERQRRRRRRDRRRSSPTTRRRTRRRPSSSTACATTSSPPPSRATAPRPTSAAHRRVHRPVRQGRRPAAAVHRRGGRAVVPAADGRVPLGRSCRSRPRS